MTTNKVIEKINKSHPELEIINISNKYATIKDAYGICKLQIYSLFNGSKPTINTAINKTEYFTNKLRQKQPNIIVVGNYTGALNRIKIRDKYGICNCTANNLLSGQTPSIERAINKTQYFINQAKGVHGERYNYDKVNYIHAKYKVKIICKEHGEFEQLPSNHLMSKGCLRCANKDKGGGWYKHVENAKKRTTLYLIEFTGNNEVFIKFGVTVNLPKRIRTLTDDCNKIYKIKVIKKIVNTVEYCYNLEQKFKRKIRHNKLQYIPKTNFGGMYECFKTENNKNQILNQ